MSRAKAHWFPLVLAVAFVLAFLGCPTGPGAPPGDQLRNDFAQVVTDPSATDAGLTGAQVNAMAAAVAVNNPDNQQDPNNALAPNVTSPPDAAILPDTTPPVFRWDATSQALAAAARQAFAPNIFQLTIEFPNQQNPLRVILGGGATQWVPDVALWQTIRDQLTLNTDVPIAVKGGRIAEDGTFAQGDGPFMSKRIRVKFAGGQQAALGDLYFWSTRSTEQASGSNIWALDLESRTPSLFYGEAAAAQTCVGCHQTQPQGNMVAVTLDGAEGDTRLVGTGRGAFAARQTVADGIVGSYPHWSPDGTRIATAKGGHLYVYDVSNPASPQQWDIHPAGLTAAGHPCFSADGRSIFCAVNPNIEPGNADTTFFQLPLDLYRVDLPNTFGTTVTSFTRLTTDGDQGHASYYPIAHPNGRWLAFTWHDGTTDSDSYASEGARIKILDLETPGRVIEQPALNANDQPDQTGNSTTEHENSWPGWDATGEWITFSSKRLNENADMFIAKFDAATGLAAPAAEIVGANDPDSFDHVPSWVVGAAP